jgi:hypothetical protein
VLNRFSRVIGDGTLLLFLIIAPLALITLMGPSARAQLALGFGSTADDQGRAVAVDAVGNTYITGYFNGTVDFDPGPGDFELTAGAVEAAFVASYDPAGALRYALSFGGMGYGIAVDDAGNVFVTGVIGSGGVDVDPGPDEVVLDWQEGKVFVVSYDPGGNLRFGFNVGGGITNIIEAGHAMALDGAGNVYITGVINEETDFIPGAGEEIVPINGITDSFLASYSNTGGFNFAIGIGGSFSDIGLGVAVDAVGNSYVTGTFRDTVDFDPGPEVDLWVSNGNREVYLASYSPSGAYRFALTFGGLFDDLGNAVAIDAAGNSFVTGAFRDQVDFDPGPSELILTSEGNEDFYLASYTDSGDLRFAFGLGNTNPMQGLGVAVDNQGFPYVTGFFTNVVDFDPGPDDHILGGGFDAYVASYTNSGDYRFVYNFPDIGLQSSDSGQGIEVDTMGRPHVVGVFGGTTDFDPGSGELLLTSNGSNDIFLTNNQLDPVGVESESSGLAVSTITSAFPNPAAGQMRLTLEVPEASHVNLAVYDVAGRLVSRLHSGFLPAGTRRDFMLAGDNLPSGLYFVRIADQRGARTEKLMIVR